MIIAYVLADFPVFSETFVGDEIRAMQALGHTIVPIVMSARREKGQDADQDLAASAFRLPSLPNRLALSALPHLKPGYVRGLSFARKQRLLPLKSLAANAMKISAIAAAQGATHFHAHFAGGAAAHAIVAARSIGASVSFICHGHDVYSEPEDLPAKLEAADFVIATCADMAADLRAMAPTATVHLWYCGIDPAAFTFSGEGAHNGRLLFIGRLVEQKGVGELIEALGAIAPEKRLPLDIVGDGPRRAAWEQLAQDKGLLGTGVTFHGAKPRGWFIENGPAYAALVAPFKTGTKGERDSGPTVIKEAMAMGLPVAASRYMGVKEMIVPGTGLLSEPGDVAGLARAIEAVSLWTDNERREVKARARAHVAKGFSLANQAAELSLFMENAQAKIKSNSNKKSRSFSLSAASAFYGKYFHKP